MEQPCYDDCVSTFLKLCAEKRINGKVHQERFRTAKDVIGESLYVDLILIDQAVPSSPAKEKLPTKFVRDILTSAGCPVIINPLRFGSIDEIIFTFDGSLSSVFANKQFTYPFPGLHDRKACILNVVTPGQAPENDIQDLKAWV